MLKVKLKVRLLPPPSTDAGRYTAINKDTFQWETPVQAVWLCPKQKGVLVKGKEFLRLGGDSGVFKEDIDYIWGCFEVVE